MTRPLRRAHGLMWLFLAVGLILVMGAAMNSRENRRLAAREAERQQLAPTAREAMGMPAAPSTVP